MGNGSDGKEGEEMTTAIGIIIGIALIVTVIVYILCYFSGKISDMEDNHMDAFYK